MCQNVANYWFCLVICVVLLNYIYPALSDVPECS